MEDWIVTHQTDPLYWLSTRNHHFRAHTRPYTTGQGSSQLCFFQLSSWWNDLAFFAASAFSKSWRKKQQLLFATSKTWVPNDLAIGIFDSIKLYKLCSMVNSEFYLFSLLLSKQKISKNVALLILLGCLNPNSGPLKSVFLFLHHMKNFTSLSLPLLLQLQVQKPSLCMGAWIWRKNWWSGKNLSYNSNFLSKVTSHSSWWLNQPIWKICSSKWVHLPQMGLKIKNVWNHQHVYHLVNHYFCNTHHTTAGTIHSSCCPFLPIPDSTVGFFRNLRCSFPFLGR